jgi:chorismate mutase/prephenate dehydratase
MDEKVLLQAREEIGSIDAEMAALFCRRMQVVGRVAAYKKDTGMPVFDGARERALIERNCALVQEEYRESYLRFLQHTLQLSREYQLRLLGNDAAIDAALTEGDASI